MPRTVYVIPADADPDDHVDDAIAAGAAEVARGIPPALAAMFGDDHDLPVALTIPDPPVPAPDPAAEQAATLEPTVAAAEDALVALFDKVAGGGTLTATDKAAIPDLAVKALGGRAKVDRLRGGPPA